MLKRPTQGRILRAMGHKVEGFGAEEMLQWVKCLLQT